MPDDSGKAYKDIKGLILTENVRAGDAAQLVECLFKRHKFLLWVLSLVSHKPGLMTQAINFTVQEVEEEGSRAQGYPCLYDKFLASLSYIRYHFKNFLKKKKGYL